MGQEFFINSQGLEDKIRQLLPSQGGAGAGFDLSASTQIIPIIDLTESAEGSNLRADLQTAIGFTGLTSFEIINETNTTVISNTGYWRIWGQSTTEDSANQNINLFDGSTSKNLIVFANNAAEVPTSQLFDYIVYIKAGESLRATAGNTNLYNRITIGVRQIADIDGVLVNP